MPEGSGPVALGISDTSPFLWVAAGREASVFRVDTRDLDAPPERFGTGGGVPSAISVAPGGSVWIAKRDSDSVVALSPTGTTLVDMSLDERCDGPNAIASLDGAVWVSCLYSSNIVRLDPRNGSLDTTLDVDGDPGPLALDERGAVWVAIRASA